MNEPAKPLLTARYGIAESWKLANAEPAGAYRIAREALTTRKPAEISRKRSRRPTSAAVAVPVSQPA